MNKYSHAKNYITILILAIFISSGVGCSSSNNQNRASRDTFSEKEKINPEATKGAVPPSNSQLSKIREEMDDNAVIAILGNPDDSNGYSTGKTHIPFYHGTDTFRVEWMYKGEGRVVFSKNRYSGRLKVIRIDYNPNELEFYNKAPEQLASNQIKDLPANIKSEIKQKCTSKFPSDYAQQSECAKKQEAGWLDLNR